MTLSAVMPSPEFTRGQYSEAHSFFLLLIFLAPAPCALSQSLALFFSFIFFQNIFPWVQAGGSSRAGQTQTVVSLRQQQQQRATLVTMATCNAASHWSDKLTFLFKDQSEVLIEFFFLLFVLKI